VPTVKIMGYKVYILSTFVTHTDSIFINCGLLLCYINAFSVYLLFVNAEHNHEISANLPACRIFLSSDASVCCIVVLR
jgi:hypothetical protein